MLRGTPGVGCSVGLMTTFQVLQYAVCIFMPAGSMYGLTMTDAGIWDP